MNIYAFICPKLVLTQFWPKIVSWRFKITTDALICPPGKSIFFLPEKQTVQRLSQWLDLPAAYSFQRVAVSSKE